MIKGNKNNSYQLQTLVALIIITWYDLRKTRSENVNTHRWYQSEQN